MKLDWSYHHEYSRKHHFVEKYKEVKNPNTFIIFNLPLTINKVLEAQKYLSDVDDDVFLNKLDSNKYFTADYDMNIFSTLTFTNAEMYDCIIDGQKTQISEQDIFANNNANFSGFKCYTKAYSIDVEGVFRTERDFLILPLKLNNHNFNRSIICPVQRCICGDGFKFKKYKGVSF
jgi:hypothetical protein